MPPRPQQQPYNQRNSQNQQSQSAAEKSASGKTYNDSNKSSSNYEYKEQDSQRYNGNQDYRNSNYSNSNYQSSHQSYQGDNNFRGGRGYYRGSQGGRGRGRGGYHGDREQNQEKRFDKPDQKVAQPVKQDLKKTNKGLFSSEFDKAFGPPSSSQTQTEEEAKQEQQIQPQNHENQQQSIPKNESQVQETTSKFKSQNEIKQNTEVKEKAQSTLVIEKNQQIQSSSRNGNTNDTSINQEQIAQTQDQNLTQDGNTQEITEEQSAQQVEEEKKAPVKVDFVPDPNFSWDLDLEGTMKTKAKKKTVTKDGAPVSIEVPKVIKSSAPKSSALKEKVKLRIASNLECSTIQIDKINKGLTNSSNCCYMNVILQSLLSIPAFFNMLIAISKQNDIMQELNEDSLLRKFVYLALYFDPTQQLDRKSPFAANPVNGEQIFMELNNAFNPYREHQDCHEFLVLVLDTLHEELKKIYVPEEDTDKKAVVDEWQETGPKNAKCKFNNDQMKIENSVIRDIFGGVFRNELQVGGSKDLSITYEPFFIINLETTRLKTLQDSLVTFFKSRILEDYKLEGKQVRATHHQHIDKLPNILILQLKRFLYRDGPIKLDDFIEFPQVLRIQDSCLSPHLRLGTFTKVEQDENGRSYRLASIVIHKGTQLSRGHYICYVLDADDNWIQYNDNRIKKIIDLDQVFESSAYLLFYELI